MSKIAKAGESGSGGSRQACNCDAPKDSGPNAHRVACASHTCGKHGFPVRSCPDCEYEKRKANRDRSSRPVAQASPAKCEAVGMGSTPTVPTTPCDVTESDSGGEAIEPYCKQHGQVAVSCDLERMALSHAALEQRVKELVQVVSLLLSYGYRFPETTMEQARAALGGGR